MVRKTLACTLLLLASVPLSAMADNVVAKFKGGIGVDPVSSAQGAAPTSTVVNRNIVRGVQPPGQLWVISDLAGVVTDDGHISVNGKGLLLAGGNAIASNANASVFATLICEAAAPFTEHSTAAAGVALEPNGDFSIDDTLDNLPVDGALACASPVLLIRNANNRAWFAAGIPKR